MTRAETITKLTKNYNWDPEVLEMGIRARFKCEYCDADMLASVDGYYYIWNNDHVVPTSKGGKDDFENMAIACRTCNFMKSNRDLPKPAETREEKIAVWREWIRNRRTEKQTELAEIRGLCNELLGEEAT